MIDLVAAIAMVIILLVLTLIAGYVLPSVTGKSFHEAQVEIQESFDRMIETITIEFLPILERFTLTMEEALEKMQRFVSVMNEDASDYETAECVIAGCINVSVSENPYCFVHQLGHQEFSNE